MSEQDQFVATFTMVSVLCPKTCTRTPENTCNYLIIFNKMESQHQTKVRKKGPIS